MSDQLSADPSNKSTAGSPPLFNTEKPADNGSTPVVAWTVAGLVVLVAIGILLIAGRKKSTAPATRFCPWPLIPPISRYRSLP